jgi:2-aminoadipate transaminase
MLTVASRPEILSFALGLPAPEFFPTELYAEAVARVLSTDPAALQYGPPFRPLKRHIRELMKQRGVACTEEQIFLTTGAQQGMNLLAHLLLDHGGRILTEELTYTGFQQVVESFEAEILTVKTDLDSGLDVDAVESVLAEGLRPALIYTVTDGHNPLGVSMSPAKRVRLVELARRYQTPIVEDDAYGFLHYDSTPTPPLRALDEQWVCYVGSFSKILAPSLRVGWIIVPEALMSKLSILKEASDINTATLAQRSVSAYLDRGLLDSHLAQLRQQYRARRDSMLRALRDHFPPAACWRTPTHGVFIWVEFAGELDMNKLLQVALEEEKIAFVPGQAFYVRGARHRQKAAMRLNFSNCNVERIEDGIKRLARLVNRA